MKRLATLYKDSYTGLNPASWLLSVVMLVNRCGTMVVPFMALYLTQSLHFSMGRAGFVVALFGAGAICGGFIGGRLSDRFGFYPVQLVALTGGGVGYMLLGQMHTYASICIVTFVLSVINESFRPANSLAIAHYSKEENRTRSYSLNRLAINLGWALGGTLGGFIASHNYSLLFWIDGGTNLLAALWLVMFLKAPKAEHKHAQETSEPESKWIAYKDKAYMAFCVLVVMYAFSFFQLFSTLPVFFKAGWGLSEKQIGITMAANGLIIALIEMVLIYRLEGRREPLQYIKWGTLLIAISYLILLVPNGGFGLAMVSTLVVTAGEMFSMPFMNTYWISRTTAQSRGQYAGLYTVSWAIAQVLGPYTGSKMVDALGFGTLWWIIGGIAIISGVGFWALQKMTEPKPVLAAVAE